MQASPSHSHSVAGERIPKAAILLAIFLIGAAGPASSAPRCERAAGWRPSDTHVGEGHYIPVAVRSATFVVNRWGSIDVRELREYLSNVRREMAVRPYIFLISRTGFDCAHFARAAKVVSSASGCISSGTCIWGHRLGEEALPGDVPKPTHRPKH